MSDSSRASELPRYAELPRAGRVCRLGLATRGNTRLSPAAVELALERGVDYLNWCGHPDGLQAAIRGLGRRRADVRVAVQMEARTADDARRELDSFCEALATDYIDVVTYYYVEHPDEWRQIISSGGAADALEAERAAGRVRAIGLTSHQRPLSAGAAASGRLDLLMIRYNAAHRGAERDVFPVTRELGVGIVAFTGLRWGGLLRSTPDDPPGFDVPRAPAWYRFVLSEPSVCVALMAPDGDDELRENLSLLEEWRGLMPEEHAELAAHGARVRRHAGGFP